MKSGFTLIELIMTMILIGVIMVPLGLMCNEYIHSIIFSRDAGVAEALAKLEMAKINNLSYSDATLVDGYDNTASNYEGYNIDLRREIDYVAGSSNNLKKAVLTLYEGGTSSELAQVASYIADVSFGAGSGGGGVGSEDEAGSLSVTGGSISAKRLRNINLENTSATDDITISEITVSWTNSNPSKPASLTSIDFEGGVDEWSGSESSSGTTIDITDFTLTAATTYNNSGVFTFSQNISSVTLTFIMSDGSSTAAIVW